ncbi:hypothetical protein J6590_082268 [Homalodisca vitripennis]|nr:hypothetical protein J6590_082268 [Homalodisca vitripennis]
MVRSSGQRCDPVWRVCGSGGRQGGVEEAHRRGKESTEICYAPAVSNLKDQNACLTPLFLPSLLASGNKYPGTSG